MDDFIFGTLATEELRRERVRAARAGVTHLQDREPRDPAPGQPVRLRLSLGPEHYGRRAWVYWTLDGSEPQGRGGKPERGFSAPMRLTGTEWDTILWGYRSRFEAVLPGQPAGTLLRYRLSAEEHGGDEVFADGGIGYAVYIDDDPAPAWTKTARVYQIFVDRFYPGDGRAWQQPDSLSGFYGGTLRGVTQKLDYIVELGFNTLWLTPIFPSPSHHGYDATDLFEVEPRLGSKADLRELLDEAHRRGMRVLLDFVPNHISNRHPFFRDAVTNPGSPYREWFNFTRWPEEYETFFGVKELPQLDLRHPEARQHVLDAARYWLDFGADGFRVDYAIGPAPEFWAFFRQATLHCWTFGEIVDPPDVQLTFAGLLDGALDFMLLEALRQTFAFGRWPAARLISFLQRHEAYFPAGYSRPSFLDNHDMNRFLWAAGGDKRRLRAAAACQYTLSGPPVVYYGTEVGLSQQRDVRQDGRGIPEEARLPMLWGDQQDQELLTFYRRLNEMRAGSPALQSGSWEPLDVPEPILAYRRASEEETLLVTINLHDAPQTFTLAARCAEVLLETDPACSVWPQGKQTEVELPALGAVVLRQAEPSEGAER